MVGNKNFTDVTKPSEIVQLLLNDDQLANLDTSTTTGLSAKKASKRPAVPDGDADGEPVRDLWNDEGDDFFGHSGMIGSNGGATEVAEDENPTPGPATSRGKKRKGGTTSASRGRKTKNGKKKSGTTTGDVTPAPEES